MALRACWSGTPAPGPAVAAGHMAAGRAPLARRMNMPIVQIITTGGTIAHNIDPATGAALPTLKGEELVAEVPALADVAQVRVVEFGLLQSWNMTPALAADLARRVRDALADPEVTGVVVAHGTDTMEETAFALDLVLDTPRPVVLTGAMRNPSQPGPDGPRNVVSAAHVATDPAARDLGVLVVLNDEIHAARYVTKGTPRPWTRSCPAAWDLLAWWTM